MMTRSDADTPFLATHPAEGKGRRLALSLAAASLALFLLAIPYAQVALPHIPPFILIYQTVLIITDLITAILLFGHATIQASTALRVLASGYLFTAGIAALHGLTFPGAFAAQGLLGAGKQTTAWLYMFWHGGFPLFVIGYARLRDRAASARSALPLALGSLALVSALTWLATRGEALLPPLMNGNRFYLAETLAALSVVGLDLLALWQLSRRTTLTVLDIWLMVVMTAWVFDTSLSALLNASRFDLGFYLGRAYGMVASTFVLAMILLENNTLYERLARLHTSERQKTDELTRARDMLTLARDSAEASNRIKSEFLANMSHEIRTPMNAVLGLAYLIEQRPLDSESLSLVRKIRNAGNLLQAIINDILDFSKIEAGRLEIERAPFNLADVLSNLATIMADAVGDKPVELTIAPPPADAYYLIGDALRLGQVLINLTSNAIKFTERGAVTVDVQAPHRDGNHFLRFAVRDTGIGIDQAQQNQIFTAFTQADSSTTRRFGGTGLGLTISRQLVVAMGGEIGVESTPGIGSEFWFTIPFDRGTAPSYATPHLVGLRILIAAASAMLRDNLAQTARALGWHPTLVDSDLHAVEFVLDSFKQHRAYDVVLLDWQMPWIDGLAAALEIRRHQRNEPHLPTTLIVCSARAREELLKRPGVEAIHTILNKPVTGSTLYDAVANARLSGGATPSRAKLPRLTGVRILVVDDSEINREVAQRILEGEGARVALAGNGKQAIEGLQAEPDSIDLVLMDAQMPVMDGYEATRRIRQLPPLAHLPVVALTAGAFREQQDAARAAGMDDFVVKPFVVEQLLQVIQRLTGRHGDAPAADEPAPAVTGALPGLDLQQGLRAWRDVAVYHRFLDKFAHDYADSALALDDAIAQGDIEQARRLAHKLKGAAGSLALPDVAKAAAELEMALARATPSDAAQHALQAALATVVDSIGQLTDTTTQVRPAPAAPPEDLATERLHALLLSLDSDDMARVEPVVSALKELLTPTQLVPVLTCLDNYDFRGAEREARALAQQLGLRLERKDHAPRPDTSGR